MDNKEEKPEIAVLCLFCTHLREANDDMVTCDAFPDGIPMDILDGTTSHEEPYLDDHGIQYEEKVE